MTDLLELTARIRETKDAIASHERALAQRATPSLEASLQSLQKRLAKLETELAELGRGHAAFQNDSETAPASKASAK